MNVKDHHAKVRGRGPAEVKEVIVLYKEPVVRILYDDGTVEDYHHHLNGGGLVANTAKVDDTAFVDLQAIVAGRAQVLDQARLEGAAEILHEARVCHQAVVGHDAVVAQ